jgi:hypothetical protein
METVFLILLIIILIAFCVAKPLWRTHSRKQYIEVEEKIGSPDYVNPGPNGVAIWKMPKNTPFKRVMVVDEKMNNVLVQKCIYLTTKLYVDPRNVCKVLSIANTIMYDRLKNEITVKGSSLAAAMATIVLAQQVNKEIIPDNLINEKYKNYIQSSAKNENKNFTHLCVLKDEYDIAHGDNL